MSKIEWTNETWNPITGCTKISPACENCYAIPMSFRLQSIPNTAEKYAGIAEKTKGGKLNFTGKVSLHEPSLDLPRKWKKPCRIFVNSMGDLFHGNVPFEWVDRVMVVIEDCPQHTFQILKKRPERMREYFSTHPVPRNAWLGVTVENQHTADERIPYLLSIDAEVRFLSCEPLLEAITVPSIEQIGWLIAGGEAGTGKRIRPMHPDWARDLRDQCRAAGVPFFFKQWGRFLPASQATEKQAEGRETCLIAGEAYYDMGGKQAGNVLDGQTHEEFPEFTCACCGAKDNATGYKNPARKFVACDGHKVDAATMDGDKVYQAVIRYDGYKMVYKMVCQACAPSAKRGKRKVKQQADLL